MKHSFFIAVSVLYLMICYGILEYMQVVVYLVFNYVFVKVFIRYKWMPVANFLIIMSMLSIAHFYQQFGPGANPEHYQADITGVLMMMMIKLTTFAFDMSDAYSWSKKAPLSLKQAKAISKSAEGQDSKSLPPTEKQSKLPIVDNATKFANLRKYPSFLEFAGYALLFPGILTGPVITFYEYRTFIDGTYFKMPIFKAKALPGRRRRAMFLFTSSLLFLVIYCLESKFPISVVIQDPFLSRPLIYRLAYIHIANFIARCRYYFAWMIAEGSYVIIGLGYRSSAAGKALWDRLENVSPFRIETGSDLRYFIGAWNVCTNQWLSTYIYKRLQRYYGKERSSARATILTNFVSAFWHGFHPAYYLMFLSFALMTVVSRLIYRNITWPYGSTSRKILLYVPVFVTIDYVTTPFMFLDLKRSLKFWGTQYFWGHVVMALITLLLTFKAKNSSRHE